ncbi:MAG TPA: NAD(P)H-binding protein, partial [Solirubrobacteraceae bacterium]
MTPSPIAVTGATGGIGSRVARRLADRGVAQRLVVRDPSRLPDLPGAEVATFGGYDDPDGLTEALRGAEVALIVSATEDADRMSQHRAAVDAAVRAGVGRIVYTSFVNASPDATFTFVRDHFHTEEHIRAAGVDHTFLRDSVYLDFIPLLAGPDGAIRGPAGAGRLAPVARD